MQTKIRLLPEEQSGLGLCCLPFHLHLSNLRTVMLIILGVLIFTSAVLEENIEVLS